MKKHFLTTGDFSKAELESIIQLALSYKKGENLPDLSDKILTLIFANPSLRTRLSFESGMKKLKGNVNVLNTADSWQFEYRNGVVMNENKQEHIKEAARVISQYTDIIGIRNCELITTNAEAVNVSNYEDYKKDIAINQLAQYSEVPIINMESNMHHPCQSMADMLTIFEKFGRPEKKKYVLTWVPHPKSLPLATPHSQLLTPAIFDMDVTLACPEGFELDPKIMAQSGAKVCHNQDEAFKDADVIVAKSWTSLQYFNNLQKEKEYRKNFSDWIVDSEKMSLTNNAIFMHCLPMRRNVEATDEVIDSPNSLIIQEAANRMWAQMGIISYILTANQ